MDMVGVLGGLGPLASAEFLRTIYEFGISEPEQDSPRVIMYSDPSFPDRTESLLSGDAEPLLARLTAALERLCDAGASRIVICCVTLHYLLPRLPGHLRGRVISLIDVALAAVAEMKGRRLLFCSTGTRKLGLFERNSMWDKAREFVVLPSERDQELIHSYIYEVKANRDPRELILPFQRLLSKYECSSFVAGCTELHLLAKAFPASGNLWFGANCIDPLTIIARKLAEDDGLDQFFGRNSQKADADSRRGFVQI
jgi:aspartate racemase